MKLMLENWKRFVNENEDLDEGLMASVMDPDVQKNVATVVRAFYEMSKVFGPVSAAGMIASYASNASKMGNQNPSEFKFDTDYDVDKTAVSEEPPTKVDTSDLDRDTEEMLKGMDWGKKRPTKK